MLSWLSLRLHLQKHGLCFDLIYPINTDTSWVSSDGCPHHMSHGLMSSPGLSWMLRLATRADRRKQPPPVLRGWAIATTPPAARRRKPPAFSRPPAVLQTPHSLSKQKVKVGSFRHFAVRRRWILADHHIVKRGQTKGQTTSALAQPRLLWTNLKCFGRTTIEDFREPVQVKLAKQSDSKPNWCQHSRQATLNQVTNVKR